MADRLAEIQALARQAQSTHQALIGEANRRTSAEARRDVMEDLKWVRDDFTNKAMPLVEATWPWQLDPMNPEDAVIIAVRNDFNDTISRIRALRDQQTLQKRISELKEATVALPSAPAAGNLLGDLLKAVLVGLIVFVVVQAVMKR